MSGTDGAIVYGCCDPQTLQKECLKGVDEGSNLDESLQSRCQRVASPK